MARIYVSSTYSDLKEHRREVSLALRRLGHEDVAMEYYRAEDERPLKKCLKDVASCDVYIGIFAFRYGHIPKKENSKGRSITELEYREALDKGKPCLLFLLSEDALWPKSKQDKGIAAEQIDKLREELITCERHMVNLFESVDELTRKVNEAVIHWEKQSGMTGERQLTDWDLYRQAVWNKHQWVRLQVIAGVSSERGVAKIPLVDVFEPQLCARGASPTELPEEVRKYQEEVIYGTKPDLPDEEVSAGEQAPDTEIV